MKKLIVDKKNILSRLPYSSPFLFVDELEEVTENTVRGNYTFRENEFFYNGHFIGSPVTPGVILTECMAQIGVVCLGIFLLREEEAGFKIALSSSHIDFYFPVFPGEKVRVTSKKIFFRFGKLKCKLTMHNATGKLVSKGEISGMIKGNE